MGGFAALHLAFRNPETFGAIAALSPAVFDGGLPEDRAWLYLGTGGRDAHDPIRLAQRAPIGGMRVFLGSGEQDYSWIRASTVTLTERLRARAIHVVVGQVPGGHDVGTWRALAEGALLTVAGVD